MSFAWKRKAVDISFFVQRRDFYVIDYCINFITWHVYGNRPAIILLKLMSFAWKRKAVDISFFVQRRDFYVIDYCINFITWHVYGMDM